MLQQLQDGGKSQREQVACPEGDLEFREGPEAEMWEGGERSACGAAGRASGRDAAGWAAHVPDPGSRLLRGLPSVGPAEAACCCSCGNALVGGERVCRKKQSVPHRGTVGPDVKGERAKS